MGDSFNIQISSNLIDRLVSDENKLRQKTKKPKKPNSPPKNKPAPPAGGWPPLHPPVFLPGPPAAPTYANEELEAIRSVLQESEKVMERLNKQEDGMVEELTQRAKEILDKEFKPPHQKPIACLDERNACLQCYEEHLKDPLKCGDVVKKFADCAREARKQAAPAS